MEIGLKESAGVLVAGVLLALVGYGTGRYLQPAKVEIKKEIEIQEKVVTKKDVVVVERTEKRPDGTIIIDRKEVDKSQIEGSVNVSQKESTVTSKESAKNRVRIGVSTIDFKLIPMYTYGIERRIAGPISIGVQGSTQGELGLTVSLEF